MQINCHLQPKDEFWNKLQKLDTYTDKADCNAAVRASVDEVQNGAPLDNRILFSVFSEIYVVILGVAFSMSGVIVHLTWRREYRPCALDRCGAVSF